MYKHVYLPMAVVTFLLWSTVMTAQNVGVGTTDPIQKLHVSGSGNQYIRVQTTSAGASSSGLDLIRANEFSGTDWRIVNDGGTLKFLDETNNFTSAGELNMVLTASGNLGLGTDSPASHLHISGSSDQILKLHRTTSGSGMAGIDFLRSSEFNSTDWRVVNDGGLLKFLDATDNFATAGDLNMTLTQGGNLGLGTESPQAHVHIAGSTDQYLTVHRTTAGSGRAGINLLRDNEFSATDWRIVNDGGTLKFFDGIDNFGTDGDLNMVITPGGNVGIGILSPGAPLNVVGSTAVGETGSGYFQVGTPSGLHVRFDNNEILARNNDSPATLYLQYWSGNLSLCNENAGRVGIGTTSPQAKVHITDGGDVNLGGGGELVLGSTTTANLGLDGNEIQARNNGAASHLFLQASGGDVLLVPNETGQVGIGVTSSANMPSNDYLLAVDGKIISEEVRVEISGSWPDYVFQSDYTLMPLRTLEQHITTYNHLPGIPSAATIKDEGILLGDMQRAMMEKIEELTLYIIDLQNQIDALKHPTPSSSH